MATAPQGLFAFPGIKTILRGTFTLSHGISPSIATVVISPAKNFAVKDGPMLINYGQLQLLFPDCRLDMTSLSVGSGGQEWTLRIKDRRWKWENGEIVGLYNKIKPNGRIDLDTEKTPQQLAALLLDAMGEKNYEVNQLPNNTRPFIDWDYDNPAEQLARLCDSLGCRVVLGLDNRVRLWLLGNGAKLPSTRVSHGGYGFDPPDLPDSIKLVCGPTKFQARLRLEAVGRDVNGKIKRLKDLTYNPKGAGEPYGWINQTPGVLTALIGQTNLTKQIHSLALESVYRMYRIVEPATGKMEIDGFGPISDIKQLLPLDDVLLQSASGIGEQFPQSMRAQVFGKYYDFTCDPATLVNTPRGTPYTGNFSFDKERGILLFSEPVYQFVKCLTDVKAKDGTTVILSAGNFAYMPAELFVECTFAVKDAKKRQPHRFTSERKLTNGSTRSGTKIVKRDDINLSVRTNYLPYIATNYGITDTTTFADAIATPPPERVIGTTTNEKGTGLGKSKADSDKGLKAKVDYYLDAARAKFEPKENLSYTYPRIEKISPDGAIHQVTWSVGPDGAMTEASQNNEHDRFTPQYSERRLAEIARKERENLTNGNQVKP